MKAMHSGRNRWPVHLFLILMVAMGSLVLPGCKPQVQKEITVLEWQDFEDPEYWADFAKKYPDVKVNYELFQGDVEMFERAKKGDFDVIHGCTTTWLQMIEQGLILPLDTSRLVNYPDLFSQLVEKGSFNGNYYFMPVDWGYEGILVRTDKVAALPVSWSDLWKGEYAGHVSIYDYGQNAYNLTSLALKLEPALSTPTQDIIVENALSKLRPNLYNAWSDYEMLEKDMTSGDVWVAGNAWTDSFVRLKEKGVPVEYILPKEGALAWLCGYGIGKNSDNPDMAYEFINSVTTPEANAWMSQAFYYGPGNMKSLPLINQEVVDLLNLDKKDFIERMYLLPPLTKIEDEKYALMWIKVFVSYIK